MREGPKRKGPKREGGRLWAVLLAAGLFHGLCTVPWGDFEYSDRDPERRWRRLQQRWAYASWWAAEPVDPQFAPAMHHVVQRAVGIARSRAIAKGLRQWIQPQSLQCWTVRCEFQLCGLGARHSAFEADLRRLRISGKPGWSLRRLAEEGAGADCMSYRVQFLAMPDRGQRLKLANLN